MRKDWWLLWGVVVLLGCAPPPVPPPSAVRQLEPTVRSPEDGLAVVARVNDIPITASDVLDMALFQELRLPPLEDKLSCTRRRMELMERAVNEWIDLLVLLAEADRLSLAADAEQQQVAWTELSAALEQRRGEWGGLLEDPEVVGRLELLTRDVLRGQAALGARMAEYPEPGPEELQEFYQAHQQNWSHGVLARVAEILIPVSSEVEADTARQLAEEAYARIQAGMAWETAVVQYSQRSAGQSDGDLGLFTMGVLEPRIERVVFQMRVGEVSPPLRTAEGYQLFKVTEQRLPGTFPLEAVTDRLRAALHQQQVRELMRQLREQARIERFQEP